MADMTIDELKAALAEILSVEEGSEVDWINIEHLSEQTYIRLTEPETPQDFPYEDVVGYLASFRRRQADSEFADRQRQWLRTYLQA